MRNFTIPFGINIFRNGKFTGRQDLLSSIYQKLADNLPASHPHIVALYGPGGVGKTQIALEYAHLHHSNYTSVFWVDGSSEATAHKSFGHIAREIFHQDGAGNARPFSSFIPSPAPHESSERESSVPPADNQHHDILHATKRWFAEEGNTKWLLIFDNVDDLETFDIGYFFPPTSWGSIILTSRRKNVATRWVAVEVAELGADEALSMFEKGINLGRPMDEREIDTATELVQLLGFFPLAIEQASTYISVQWYGNSRPHRRLAYALEQYVEVYKKNAKSLLKKKPPLATWNYRNDTVFTTWEVSFEAVKKESLEAAELLLLCGFLASTDIFQEMLHDLYRWKDGTSKLETTGNEDVHLHDSIHILSSYSFVSFKGSLDSISIHPLIHFWAKERLDLSVQQHIAVKGMSRSLRNRRDEADSIANYQTYEERVGPHLEAVLKNAKRYAFSRCSTNSVSFSANMGPLPTSLPSLVKDMA